MQIFDSIEALLKKSNFLYKTSLKIQHNTTFRSATTKNKAKEKTSHKLRMHLSIILPIDSLLFEIFHVFFHLLHENVVIYMINNIVFPKQIEIYQLIHDLNTQ